MLVSTPMTVDQLAGEIDVALNVPANTDEMFTPEKSEQTQEATTEPLEQTTGATGQSPELSAEDKEERLWWDKVEVMGKIKDCARMIQEVEGEVDGYQDSIKEAKEVLKGQQALLARYSSQLADILDGHPLPKNPNAKTDPTSVDGASDSASGADWRDMPTDELLAGTKGLGAKKLESIMELAPTAGKLEDLRGAASMAHQMFKEVLPKGCGESMADEIENRLINHIAKWGEAVDDINKRDGIAEGFEDAKAADDGKGSVLAHLKKKWDATEPAGDDEEYDDVE